MICSFSQIGPVVYNSLVDNFENLFPCVSSILRNYVHLSEFIKFSIYKMFSPPSQLSLEETHIFTLSIFPFQIKLILTVTTFEY